MRCYCCNEPLTPKQSTRKFKASETFTDMCDECLATIVDYDLDTVEGEGEDEDEGDEDE